VLFFLMPALVALIKRLRKPQHADLRNQSRPDASASSAAAGKPAGPAGEPAGLNNPAVPQRNQRYAAALWGGLGIVLAAISIALRIWTFAGLAAVLVLGAAGLLITGNPATPDGSGAGPQPPAAQARATVSPPRWGDQTENLRAHDGPVSSFLLGTCGPAVLGLAGLALAVVSIVVRTWSVVGLSAVLIGGAVAVTARRRPSARRNRSERP
jgi:hypothetical protein